MSQITSAHSKRGEYKDVPNCILQLLTIVLLTFTKNLQNLTKNGHKVGTGIGFLNQSGQNLISFLPNPSLYENVVNLLNDDKVIFQSSLW